jgi:methylglutaconyl-CoA hydratase
MAVDAEWRDADWCERHGLYARVFDDVAAMDAAVERLAATLARSNPEAMLQLKRIFWSGTDDWEALLGERARMSGTAVLSGFTRDAIAGFRARQRPASEPGTSAG